MTARRNNIARGTDCELSCKLRHLVYIGEVYIQQDIESNPAISLDKLYCRLYICQQKKHIKSWLGHP